jgi:hypothetical protein
VVNSRCERLRHRLKNVDLANAPARFSWANKVAKIIREKWQRDAFFVKLKIVMK